MILYPPAKPELETLAGQGFEIANFQHISRGKTAVWEESDSTLSPRPFPIQGKGAGPFWSRCPEDIQKHRSDFCRKRCFA